MAAPTGSGAGSRLATQDEVAVPEHAAELSAGKSGVIESRQREVSRGFGWWDWVGERLGREYRVESMAALEPIPC